MPRGRCYPGITPIFSFYGEKWPFRTYQRLLPPSKYVLGGVTSDSIVSDGCVISGAMVSSCILSPGVVAERGAFIERSIVFDDVAIEPSARIRRAVIDKNARIEAGAQLGFDHEADKRRGCSISDCGIVVVPKGMVVGRD